MHTPGPWKVNQVKKSIMAFNGGSFDVAKSVENESNARLIAAAPDMLVVLKEAVDHAHVYDTNPALVELFKAVIAKIENK
jgi:hypothetical protein